MASFPNDVFFRPMARQDLPRLAELDRVSNHPAWSLKMFERELELEFSLALVGILGDRAVAFVVAWLVARAAQIQQLAVDPQARRRGLATRMLEHLAGEAGRRGCVKMELEVREGNLAAVGLYEKLGFKAVGNRKDFYDPMQPSQPPESAVLMERPI